MAILLDSEFKSQFQKANPNLPLASVQVVLALHAEGNTVPFMARYRKEKTGNLDEIQIRDILNFHENWIELVKRKGFVLKEIEKQGNLTEELRKQITSSYDLGEVEELYRPFKRKKKTKATLAKEAGLQPLADWIWKLGQGELKEPTTLEVKAKEFINPKAGYATYEEVLRGVQHILVEKLSNTAELRSLVREEAEQKGVLISQKSTKFKTHSKYEMYADFKESAKSLMSPKTSHRYLALRRGWQEGELKVSLELDEEKLEGPFRQFAIKESSSQANSFLENCSRVALKVHVIPSVTNELHRKLKEVADEHAISVFSQNLRRVLMASPFGSKVVLGVDPGLKTGCKLSLIGSHGQFISHTVMHILGKEDKEKAKKLFSEVLKQIEIEAIAVGNGTGGREAEAFIREVLKELEKEVPVVLVNESGASIYSASPVAQEEFPDLDLTVRGAISIARRMQDPLAELVKIDPKSIGVGQYQHDVSQPQLKKSLHDVVESCVNQVGVNLNTASEALLQYVSGIGPAIAKNVVKYRKEKGLYKERKDLEQVPQFSSKVFEQAAGFLRIPDSVVPLDRTGIHPERYTAVREMAQEAGVTVANLLSGDWQKLKENREKWIQLVGEYTFDDIVSELEKPGRDPRDPYKVFKYREDIHKVEDLKKDMICPGVVTNVTNFGAFVDIGVHQDGLVHISEISHKFINDPRQMVNPGDIVSVKVLSVDVDKKQISLSMLTEEKPAIKVRPSAQKARRPDKGRGQAPGSKKFKANGKRKPKEGSSRSSGKGRGGGKPLRRSQPFNNPFAALGDLKK